MPGFLTYPIVQLNPYTLVGTQFTAGLDAVVAADADVESIVQAVYDYVQPIYYPFPASSATVENELKGVMNKALNGFGNQLVRQAAWMGGSTAKANVFNNRQQVFIELMLNGLQAVPVKSIANYLSDLEDHMTSSQLSLQEQAPLLMATMTGRRSFAYWMEKVVSPGDWSDYFKANAAINYANIRFWVSSSIQSALLAATRNRNNDKSQNVSIDPAHALATGLAVSAGRVMLGFVQRRAQTEIINTFLRNYLISIIINPNQKPNTNRIVGRWIDCIPFGILSCIAKKANDVIDWMHKVSVPFGNDWMFNYTDMPIPPGNCYCSNCRGPLSGCK
jgi:hypothetical protein